MKLAHLMVWRLGMGSKHLGDFCSIPESEISERLKEDLNVETERIFRECAAETEQLLRNETQLLDRFAQELLQKEELEYDEIDAIFNEYHKSKFTGPQNPPGQKNS